MTSGDDIPLTEVVELRRRLLDTVELTRFDSPVGEDYLQIWVDGELVKSIRFPYGGFDSEQHRLTWLNRKVSLGVSRAFRKHLDNGGNNDDG